MSGRTGHIGDTGAMIETTGSAISYVHAVQGELEAVHVLRISNLQGDVLCRGQRGYIGWRLPSPGAVLQWWGLEPSW